MNKSQLAGLYVHVPFCRSKCFYCNFYSVASLAPASVWLRAVRREILLYEERLRDFDSLYLGGGTPSMLEERDIALLLESLAGHFAFVPGSEMTIEANPESISEPKLKTIKDLGINRISLGVQSLDDRDLKYLGRIHSAKEALGALDLIRSCGFANIGVDLMYGLEVQTLQSWRTTLDGILKFRPEHISCYQMTFEEGALISKMRRKCRVRSIGEKLEGAFFIWTSRYLEKHGYLHYEISNFALGGEYMSRHNRKYWNHAPYLGLGPSAHSFLPGTCRNDTDSYGTRWWNVRSIRKYCELLEEGKAPIEASEALTREQFELEEIDLGFRTSDGVDILTLGGPQKEKTLAKLQESGLVKVNNGRAQPSRKGFLVADSMALMLC